jgi:hypothetical protein
LIAARCIRGITAAAASSMLLAGATAAEESKVPPVVASRKAFEAAFPKAPASTAARELEALAARLGIDLAPRDERRDHPEPEVAKAYQAVAPSLRAYVDQQLQDPSDRIDPPGDAVAGWLSGHGATLDAIVAVASGRRPISWDMDVTAGLQAPTPNVLGHVRLHIVLAARALDQARRADADAALQTADAMWSLIESLAFRSDMASQILVPNAARMVVGLVRKIDSPAWGWMERFRRRGLFESFLVAFQNDAWHFAGDAEILEAVQGMTRVNRRFVESLAARDPCGWTREDLDHGWTVAVSGEPGDVEILATIASENALDWLNRWHRYLLDAELTALVLEARGERAASREGLWPERLMNLESSVCPGKFFRYQRSPSGVVLAFEGQSPAVGRGLILPLSFRSEAAAPTPPPAVLTPAPEGGMIPPP